MPEPRASIPCPICGRPAEPVLFAESVGLETVVMQTLLALHPGWRPAEGACPICVGEALDGLRATGLDLDRTLSHQGARGDHPQVAAYGSPALPVPLRLHANPLFRGAGVTLGMLDSGFYPHPDLTQPVNRVRMMVDIMQEPVREGADFSRPEVRSWHGLMTSVVAAGNGYLSNGRYRGIASEAELVLARVGQPTLRIPDRDIERGLKWMLANHGRLGIRVLNISLGGDEEAHSVDNPLDRLVERLTAEGVLVVVAVGNSGRQYVVPPASAPSALAVGGATDANQWQPNLHHFLPWRSSFGPTRTGYPKPEVVAPSMLLAAPLLPGTRQAREAARLAGLINLDDAALEAVRDEARKALFLRQGQLDRLTGKQIRSVLADRMARHNWLSAGYQFVDGTSVAAPVVSSIAVQMVGANPRLAPGAIKAIIAETAVPMRDVPGQKQGYGVVNPAGAVAAALRAPGGPLVNYPRSPHRRPDGSIQFIYYNPRHTQVALVGDFNGWFAAESAFMCVAAGLFQYTLPPLPSGIYRYKFLLDNRTAVDDPENLDKTPDGAGGFASRLWVP